MLATFQVRTGLSAPYTDRGRKGYRVALVLKALGIGNWQLGVLTHFSMPSIKKRSNHALRQSVRLP
jgi:hypothetical protein